MDADTYVNPGILLSKMFTCALLFARTITPVVWTQHIETTHCKNNVTQCTHHQNRPQNVINDWPMIPIKACTSVYTPLAGGAALLSTGLPIRWLCELLFHFLLDRLSALATTTQPDSLSSWILTNHSCLCSVWLMADRGASPILIREVTWPAVSSVEFSQQVSLKPWSTEQTAQLGSVLIMLLANELLTLHCHLFSWFN